ncbi:MULTISPECIES: RHS repeat-associated core domain-containing protein [unclassified Acidovorax]|uniref:RHS repeat-associated core domain-containing protein n=1 Tax=unclassified Acidovorax TaxID=2684926 RepID=UPI001C43CBAF|nr:MULTISPECIES: RHS repeat-associated core domain-containing protein [unclassified Acidovorax]MBV7460166.1 EndoU domain-containing protein [Acidovorax sp. sif0632]MBV7465191.1 EndoU domain-containing protein [Acidovorax sp. sif0613]
MISTLHSFWLRLLTRLALLLAFGAFAVSAGAQTTITFFHNDILGSPAIATDADGAVVWKENYLPYGHRQRAPAAGANNKLWFAGKPYDQTNWITYMGGRYYIPLIGRFTGIDPQGIVPENPHSFNRYAYANNNPYKYVDPDGRSATLALKVLVTAAVLVGAANHLTPEQRARMEQAGALLKQRTSELLDRAYGLVFNEGTDKPSLLDPEGEQHILDGDGPNAGGGHRNGTGKPGKSEFPSNWSDDRIKGEVSDVATDPGSVRTTQPNGRTKVQGTRDGVDITVIVEPNSRGGRIVTGFPTNTPRNP